MTEKVCAVILYCPDCHAEMFPVMSGLLWECRGCKSSWNEKGEYEVEY